jgi:hypothetical protein
MESHPHDANSPSCSIAQYAPAASQFLETGDRKSSFPLVSSNYLGYEASVLPKPKCSLNDPEHVQEAAVAASQTPASELAMLIPHAFISNATHDVCLQTEIMLVDSSLPSEDSTTEKSPSWAHLFALSSTSSLLSQARMCTFLFFFISS